MSAEDVAREHYASRRRLAAAVAALARRSWSRLNPANLDASWASAAPELLVGLAGAQLAAARAADDYAAETLGEAGPDSVAADAFAGIASDGRPLPSLLLNPVTVVKAGIAGGAALDQAMAAGYANLDMLVRTQVADAGRAADQVALVAHPEAEGYTRMLVGKSCSRCTVLAGRWYRWSTGFKRHPRCDCIHVPGRSRGGGVQVDPRRAFDELSRAEQDKTFTIAGAQAIREGADIGRVVNARRGMYEAGGRQFTREATTRRGIGRQARLMPEQIYREAAGNRDEAVRLLRLHGYLTGAPRAARAVPPRAPEMFIPAQRSPVSSRLTPPPATSGRKTLRERVSEGVASSETLTGGMAAETSLATLVDGSKVVVKVAKPIGTRLTAQQQQDAEELAALVLRAVGLRAPETYRAGPNRLYMEFMDGRLAQQMPRGSDRLPERALRDEDQFKLLGLADQLIHNDDRHVGNWLITGEGNIHPIDHGLAFVNRRLSAPDRGQPMITEFTQPSSQYARHVDGVARWVDNDMSQADMALIRRRVEALRPQFERLGRQAWYEDVLSRLDALTAHAKGAKRRIRET